MDGIKNVVFTDKSLRLLGKKKYTMGHTMYYRRLIIMLQPGYSIPPLRKKRT
uniref:Ribosomal protein L23 n=1 Tax=Aeginetia indica TaxID=290220 RepID=A0A6B9XQQ5_9LAMI|nr:ribosomal protein L23 [Aeginetia indica]QHR85527.1 ribosomal protein L23 [Aeginetia indica]